MRHRWFQLCATALLLAACSTPHPDSIIRTPANTGPAAFLPTLADYAVLSAGSWVVQQQLGAGTATVAPIQTAAPHRVEPAGCDDVPYRRPDDVLAEATGRATNPGPTGFGGEASLRLIREPRGSDLLAETRAWAGHCHDYRIISTGEQSGESYTRPTAISVLPTTDVDGTELLRLHLTDNRPERFQTEGTRESVVYLARVRDTIVYGYAHDVGDLTDRLMALTIRRLDSGTPAGAPRPSTVQTTALAGRSDVEIATLLPTLTELPDGWLVAQALPMEHVRGSDYSTDTGTNPPGCDRPPFVNLSTARADVNRDFRAVAAGSAARPHEGGYLIGGFDQVHNTADTVRLGVESKSVDIITETRQWADKCGHYESSTSAPWRGRGTVEVLPVAPPPGVDDIVSVHLAQSGLSEPDFTASIMRVRGLLVTALPAVDRQAGPLLQQTLDNLRTATFTDPAPTRPPARDFDTPPPGKVTLPAPTAAATEQLGRVASGTPVDPEPYHFGGYQPGDAKVRSPQSLYFSSPTGSINCVYRQKYGGLTCDVPAGSYPRTPRPADGGEVGGTWFDHYVHFDENSIENGLWAYLPEVYAEANVLPYGHTIHLQNLGPYGDTECLMTRDGLTCVDYETRVGLHLSRDDFTPLVATDALRKDSRP